MKNTAKPKLILSGFLDLIVAIFFGMLIVFTLIYLISPLINVWTPYASEYPTDYSMVVANFFGGFSGLIVILFLATCFVFLLGLIFSFSYVKPCFSIAKMKLPEAKAKTKLLTLYGITQLIVALNAFIICIYIIVMINEDSSAKIVIGQNCLFGLAFLISGSIKLSSARAIKKAAVITQDMFSPPFYNQYYN